MNGSKPTASVIIPAHNEAATIDACLRTLLEGAAPGEFEVIVVCNGCSDATADVACRAGVFVLKLDGASKPGALNAGDSAATAWPRVFLDADIRIDAASMRALVESLAHGPTHVASPRSRIDVTKSDLGVRAFYSIWTRLPYFARGPISGAYALSQAGRRRFASFPSIISDDGFVETRFPPEERASVQGASMIISAPETLQSLIRIESRRRAGLRELSDSGLGGVPYRVPGQRRALVALAINPTRWPALGVYLWVRLCAEWNSRTRAYTHSWTRADPPGAH